MTRDQLVEQFRIVIDEVGTSEFENVDTFLNNAMTGLFLIMMDPAAVQHPRAKGFERDVYQGEYLQFCKFPVEGTAAAAGKISRAEIEAKVPGRSLYRLSSVLIKPTPTSQYRPAQFLTSSRAAKAEFVRYYAPKNCNPYLEIVNDNYIVRPSDVPVQYKAIAIMKPREVSLAQQEVDFPDIMGPAIVYMACSLAGTSIRDTEFVAANTQMIQFFGL